MHSVRKSQRLEGDLGRRLRQGRRGRHQRAQPTMESSLLGIILDSSVIIAAERKRQEDLLTSVEQAFGEVEIAISAVTLAELVHGVARANTPEIRRARRS